MGNIINFNNQLKHEENNQDYSYKVNKMNMYDIRLSLSKICYQEVNDYLKGVLYAFLNKKYHLNLNTKYYLTDFAINELIYALLEQNKVLLTSLDELNISPTIVINDLLTYNEDISQNITVKRR